MTGLIVLVVLAVVVLLGGATYWWFQQPVVKRRDVDIFDALDRARRSAGPSTNRAHDNHRRGDSEGTPR